MEVEIWKEIKETNGKYLVSNYGNIKHFKSNSNRVLRKANYYDIAFHFKKGDVYEQKSFLIHRLVAIYFIDNPHNKPCVNHKDGNKLNNHYTNLEWVTYSENTIHSFNKLGQNGAKNLDRRKTLIISKGGVEKEILGLRETARFIKANYQNVQQAVKNGCLCKGYKIRVK